MKQFVLALLCLFCLLANTTLAGPFSAPTETQTVVGTQTITQYQLWFTQKLTHFNPTNTNTWNQRVTVYNANFNPVSGTVIIFIGGESELAGLTSRSGWVVELAQQLSAIVFAVEHRFYGQSQPFGQNDQSYSTENLAYLTVDQGLADLANFINQAKSTFFYGISERNPFITIGGSYPGAMSAWFRYKYPHLTVGALASSGVVNSIYNFWQYDYQVYLSTQAINPACTANIIAFNANIEATLNAGGDAAAQIKTQFNAVDLSTQEFLYYFGDLWAALVQYGNGPQLCGFFSTPDFQTQYDQVLAYALANFPTTGYATQDLTVTTYNEASNMRQWMWQVCTQFGWFQVANPIQPMRSKTVNLAFFQYQCVTAFGAQYTAPSSLITNGYYGGNKLEATNIVFSNGSQDEWQWASITKNQGDMKAVVSTCNSCGHCGELHLPTDTDNASLVATRNFILTNFKQWIYAHQIKWLPLSNLPKESSEKSSTVLGKGKLTNFQRMN